MALIQFKEGSIVIDDSCDDIKSIIKGFGHLISKNGFDKGLLACGMMPSPDLGYFELANRFWQASLCIYTYGATFCFNHRGVGFAEPWLFNVRHAVELFIKGFLLNSIWLEEFQSDSHLSINKNEFEHLRREFGEPHKLCYIYDKYVVKITSVINNWNTNEIPEKPELKYMLLNTHELEILKELDQSDETSFRFRYPSLKNGNLDLLQKIDWKNDSSMLFSKSGLPKEAGYFFNHIKVLNTLYELVNGIKAIEKYFIGISLYQDVMNDYWADYISQFQPDF